jgi:hypothetical protein
MNYVELATTGLTLITRAIDAAQAANDDAAVAQMDALIADSAIGRRILDRVTQAQAIIDAGRTQILPDRYTPPMGVPAVATPAPASAEPKPAVLNDVMGAGPFTNS